MSATTWPGVDKLKVDAITEADCRKWASGYAARYSPTVFNNSLNMLRCILTLGGLGHDANPAIKLKRLGVRRKNLEFPATEQFEELETLITTSGVAQARNCADFVRFLAFTGCRVSEAKQATWADIDWGRNELTIHCVKRRLTSAALLTPLEFRILFSDSTIDSAINAQQWYVTIAPGRRGIRIFTPNTEQLRENAAHSGHRPLAMEFAADSNPRRGIHLWDRLHGHLFRFGQRAAATFCRLKLARRRHSQTIQKHEHKNNRMLVQRPEHSRRQNRTAG